MSGLAAAERALRDAAVAAEVGGDTPDARHDGLLSWQRRRHERLEASERAQEAWDALQRVLAGQTLDEVAAEAEALGASARAARDALGAAAPDGAAIGSVSVEEFERREREASPGPPGGWPSPPAGHSPSAREPP